MAYHTHTFWYNMRPIKFIPKQLCTQCTFMIVSLEKIKITKKVLYGEIAHLDWGAGVGLDEVLRTLLHFDLHGELLLQRVDTDSTGGRDLLPVTDVWGPGVLGLRATGPWRRYDGGEEQVCCWRTRLRLTDQTLDQQTLEESASSLAQIKGWLWAFHFLSFILFWPIVLPEVGICKLRLLCASSNTNLASTNKLYNNENISSYSRVIHPYC